jgi:peptidoglycan/xylan/chitin deacetylase (PgdA/CDA1 family)
MSVPEELRARLSTYASDVLVLCYHAISPTWDAPVSVTPGALERQLDWLVRNGWRAITFRDVLLIPRSRRTLVISFDDAFASVFEYAYPILTRLGLAATVFAPTAFISQPGPLKWAGIEQWEATAPAELEAMSWNDLGVLADAGWEIGSHTRTHPYLTRLANEALEAELADSRADIAAHLGRSCQTIAYPYGDVDLRVAERARRAGYSAGAALSGALPNLGPHRWPRVGIYQSDDWWRFRAKASRSTRLLRASRLWPRGEAQQKSA